MGVGAGLSMYVVVVQKFTFAISSPDEFLFILLTFLKNFQQVKITQIIFPDSTNIGNVLTIKTTAFNE